MNFTHTDDRRMLADTVQRFLRDTYDINTRHKIAASESGWSKETWAKFAELGVIGALFREEDGGFGGHGFDIAVVFEELGRGLVVEPFLATAILGGGLIAELGDAGHKAILEEVIAGTKTLAFAHGEPQSRYDLSEVTATATRSGDGWVLNGDKAVVMNGDSADLLIVSARTSGGARDEDGISLFIVDPATAGVTRRGYPSIDGGHAAEISFSSVALPADALLGPEGGAYPAIETVTARGIVALSAEALGAMEVAKDMTLEYLRTRQQFGIPIGKFQALQHRMAEMLIELEQARSAVINAAGRLDTDRRTREWNVSATKNLIGRAGRRIAEEAIQMHGGIAMTWEYALPHYAKRIIMIDHQLGDTDHHMERIIDMTRAA